MPSFRVIAALTLLLSVWQSGPRAVRAERPADGLLALVPPDAAVTVVVEDLRSHARTFLESPLAGGLQTLPAVQTWRASEGARRFAQARREIEAALKVDLSKVRDDLLGDAVVLSLHPDPDGGPDQAHGLLLVRFRDRALLDRLIDVINQSERQSGTLHEIVARKHGGIDYQVRRFKPGTKADEAYAVINQVFAWSNSEALIRSVLNHRSEGGGLATEPGFRKVRDALPPEAVASLMIDPRYIQRLAEAEAEREDVNASPKLGQESFERLLRGYLSAVEYAGAAVQLRNGLIVHTHEAIDPTKLDEPLRRWGTDAGSNDELLRRVPPTALALAAGRIHFAALTDELLLVLPASERPRAERFLANLSGFFLGKDPRGTILPNLGPGMVAFVTDSRSGEAIERPEGVLAVQLAGGPIVAEALDNALRTVLTLVVLDPKRAEAGLRVESLEQKGVKVTALVGARRLLAYSVGPDLLVLGTSAEAVSAFATASPVPLAETRFGQFRAAYFPEAETFLYADLRAIHDLADLHREDLARRFAANRREPAEAARRDIDQVLALMGLFQTGFATRTVDAGFNSVHQTLGLITGDPPSTP